MWRSSVCSGAAEAESWSSQFYRISSQGLSIIHKKMCCCLSLLLHIVHLSSKANTSALKRVPGVAMATKSPHGLGHLLRFFHSPSLARRKRTWPNRQSQSSLRLQSRAESTGAPRPLSDGGVLHSSSPADIRDSPLRP